MKQLLRRFSRDQSGSATVEYAIIFLPLMLFILFIMQMTIAYHWLISAQKGLEMGARLAAVTIPVHNELVVETGIGTRVINRVPATTDDVGAPCYTGVCMAQTARICTTADTTVDETFTLNSETKTCSPTRFQQIFDEVDRFAYGIEATDLTIGYEDVGLGLAGQPFVPMVVVTLDPEQLPVVINAFNSVFQARLPTIVATMVAEDLSN